MNLANCKEYTMLSQRGITAWLKSQSDNTFGVRIAGQHKATQTNTHKQKETHNAD